MQIIYQKPGDHLKHLIRSPGKCVPRIKKPRCSNKILVWLIGKAKEVQGGREEGGIFNGITGQRSKSRKSTK